LGILFLHILAWILLHISGLKTSNWNLLYGLSYGFIPLFGGFVGVLLAKPWGGLKSVIGRAMIFVSVGSISWGIGSCIWSYYNFFLHVGVPYPSIADVGYILAIPFWCLGMVNLSIATGVKFALRRTLGKIFIFLIPMSIIALSYYILVIIARGGVLSDTLHDYLKLFFDLAYPIGDVLIVTFALVIFGLSFSYFSGRYRLAIVILLAGYVFMYMADFLFSYTTTLNTYFNGDWPDLFFPIALSLMIVGVFGFALKES